MLPYLDRIPFIAKYKLTDTLLRLFYIRSAYYMSRSYVNLQDIFTVIYRDFCHIHLGEQTCKLLSHLHSGEHRHEELRLLISGI